VLRPIAKNEPSARVACRKDEAAAAARLLAPQKQSWRNHRPLRGAVTPTSAKAQASALAVAQAKSSNVVFMQVGSPLSGQVPPQGGGSYA
jgi:hypothetical protein